VATYACVNIVASVGEGVTLVTESSKKNVVTEIPSTTTGVVPSIVTAPLILLGLKFGILS
jgi:hypothetical protein